MSYVPGTPPPISPRVRELSRRVTEVVDEFRRQYPMSAGEVRQALRLAASEDPSGRRRAVLALGLGLSALFGVGVVLLGANESSRAAGAVPWGMIAAGIGVLAVGAAVILLRSR